LQEEPLIERVKSIRIFFGRYHTREVGSIEGLWQRKLEQDSIDLMLRIVLMNDIG
jgi:hypothetical protein